MKGKNKFIIMLFALITLVATSVSFAFSEKIKRIEYSDAAVIDGFTGELDGGVIFSAERVYMAEDRTKNVSYNGVDSKGIYTKSGLEYFMDYGLYNSTDYSNKDIIYDDCGETVLTNGTPYTTQHVFYFYPNEYRNSVDSEEWAPRATRCVVELLIDDVLYYYPISFHFVTDSNMEHDMNITITRLGVSSPDVAATSSALTTEVRVSPWTEGSAINVTF